MRGTTLERHSHWHPEPGPLPTECYIWDGYINPSVRYPTVTHGKRTKQRLSRLVTEERCGPPFPGAQASHLCDNPACVRPEHIIWETAAQNIARVPKEKFQHNKGKGRKGGVDKLPSGSWRARVTVDGKIKTLGLFMSEELARKAYADHWK